MPATERERLMAAMAVANEELAPDSVEGIQWEDGDRISPQEMRDVFAIAAYELHLRFSMRPAARRAQRKAMRLLRSNLSAQQRTHLRTCGYFYVRASSGGVYRLYPGYANVERVVLHRTRYYPTHHYCLHPDLASEPDDNLPSADISLSHLLWLYTDEGMFLSTANERPCRTQLWDGEYLRRMRAARRARQERANGGPTDIDEARQRVLEAQAMEVIGRMVREGRAGGGVGERAEPFGTADACSLDPDPYYGLGF